MVAIKVKKYLDAFRKEGSQKIQTILFGKGYYATTEQCIELWEMYSEHWCSGWLDMGGYSDDEIYQNIKPYFEASGDLNRINNSFSLQE